MLVCVCFVFVEPRKEKERACSFVQPHKSKQGDPSKCMSDILATLPCAIIAQSFDNEES
jgi:hypothetical protein